MLSTLQLELIKSLSNPLPDSLILEIRKLLVEYYASKIDEGIDELFEKNNWDLNEKINEWQNENFHQLKNNKFNKSF